VENEESEVGVVCAASVGNFKVVTALSLTALEFEYLLSNSYIPIPGTESTNSSIGRIKIVSPPSGADARVEPRRRRYCGPSNTL
jgi:hypothetical protein